MFICTKCDAQILKWTGRCTECGGWGTLKESEGSSASSKKSTSSSSIAPASATSFATLPANLADAIPTGISFLDTCLSGGLVTGSVTLLSGEPGIGKSTIIAQLALQLARTGKTVAYVTGEESPTQILKRFQRLSKDLPPTLVAITETDVDAITSYTEKTKPDLVIIDSIQSVSCDEVSGEAGSISQVKACTAMLAEVAKRTGVRTLLIGQVTKDGDIAGPRVLEHAVDTVLILEGDRGHAHRLLRVIKHRFGTTDEFALLDMTEQGLVTIEDPSKELLADRPTHAPGTVVTCLIHGSRALLIEIQALTNHAGYGTPVRRATGVDSGRLGMLIAVIARHAQIRATEKDVYVNAVGGLDARDSSMDLAICLAIASANGRTAVSDRVGCIGEVGLAGELRPVANMEKRLQEFARMGFETVVSPILRKQKIPTGLNVIQVKTVAEAIDRAGLRTLGSDAE